MVACDFLSKDIYTLYGKFTAYSVAFIHYASRRVFVSPPTYSSNEDWVMQQARPAVPVYIFRGDILMICQKIHAAIKRVEALDWLEDEGIKLRYFLHDHDTKFTEKFSDFFQVIIDDNYAQPINGKKKKGEVIQTAVRCPMQNGYIETWIGHFKRECLNYFWCFTLRQFDRILYKYEKFHNNYRPHQNKDNCVLHPDFKYPKGIQAGAVHKTNSDATVDKNAGEEFTFDARNVKSKKILGGLLRHYYLDNDNEQAA